VVRERLEQAGIERPDVEAWQMLEHVSGTSKLDWLTRPDLPLGPGDLATLEGLVAGRAAGIPLQHLLGTAPFWGMTLVSTPDALVPRPETEGLVALGLHALEGRAAPVVLDLGTGSGAIAIAIAVERPDAEVWASERSAAAVQLAETNFATHAPNVRLVQADLLDRADLRELAFRLDLLIANLPYLPDADAEALPAEVKHDPPEALFGGSDGLDLFRRAWQQADALLPPNACAVFELDPRNVRDAATWLARRPNGAARRVTIEADLAGRERFLVVGQLSGAPSPPNRGERPGEVGS